MTKKILAPFFALFVATAFAQTANIPTPPPQALPDYTDTAKADLDDSAPSLTTSPLDPLPADAGVSDDKASSEKSATLALNNAKQVWAEGIVALGYPLLVNGDFSIYRQTGRNPFKISCGIDSMTGYSGKPLTSGFSDRATHIDAEKTFNAKAFTAFISAYYNESNDGLQNSNSFISDIEKIDIGASVAFDFDFKKPTVTSSTFCNMEVSLAGLWYTRFGSLLGEAPDMRGYEEKINVFDVDPRVSVNWGVGNFKSTVTCSGFFERDLDNVFTNRNAGRGSFSLDARYNFVVTQSDNGATFERGVATATDNQSIYGLFARVECVAANTLEDHKAIVPFCAGLDAKIQMPLSTKDAGLYVAGGLQSHLNRASNVERQYKYADLSQFADETAFWYTKASFSLPIKEMFTFNVGLDFKTTALDLGTLEPLYDKKRAFRFGQYAFSTHDDTQLNTDIMVAFSYKIVSLYLDWTSFWLDVPLLETTNKLTFNISLQDKTARFFFDANADFQFGENADYTPEVDFDFTVRATNFIRLALISKDFIKLVSATTRDYQGVYIRRSGSISLAAKLSF